MDTIAEYTGFRKSLLPLDRMRSVLADGAAASYAKAEPYPHIVLDDFFDPVILDRILDEFPSKDQIEWERFKSKHETKLVSKSEGQLGLFTRYLIYQLNSSTFLNFIEELTGIPGLIPDPHLTGGGLHQIVPGGKLGVHADFNRDERLKLDRRLNVLVALYDYTNGRPAEEVSATGGHSTLFRRVPKDARPAGAPESGHPSEMP